MDIVNSLLGRLSSDPEDELTPEEREAEAKRERIEFHRKHVRNGPTNFRSVTNGQVRRAEQRAQDAVIRKTRKRHRRNWLVAQQRQATLRGQLQQAGVLALHDGSFAEPNPAIVRVLVKDWGSVVDAKAAWDEVQAKRLESAKREVAAAARAQKVRPQTPLGQARDAGFAR